MSSSREALRQESPNDESEWIDEDDDLDYTPADDGLDEEDALLDQEMEDEFHDAAENLSGPEISFEITDEDVENGEEDDGGSGGDSSHQAGQPIYVTQRELFQLFSQRSLQRIFHNHATRSRAGPANNDDEAGDDSDNDYGAGYGRWGSRRRRTGAVVEFEKVPSEKGRELMNSGTFGFNERLEDSMYQQKKQKKLAYRLMRRELGLGNPGRQKAVDKLAVQSLIPATKADLIIHYNKRCYSGQFSNDGNFFFSCAQDFRVRMYDTSNPYDWKYYKTLDCPSGTWTITDASLSPDNRFLAYSSISSTVYMAPTDPMQESDSIPLEFSSGRGTGMRRQNWGYRSFGIWSIRFSGDGREIVAGTGNSSVCVYDTEYQETVLQIDGHEDDVNAVCYADPMSPHILYSGSDDTTLKVWDRRSMADKRPAGVFLGHTEGLTYVDSKGDGRYILSNAKDQTAKLWDLRRMMSPDKADQFPINGWSLGFEYRSGKYPIKQWQPHPHDSSLVTFRGHQVLRTLIRCHFSPPGSTDSRYVYSGSYDGCVYVWNMDATRAGKIDVESASRDSRQRTAELIQEPQYRWMDNIDGEWKTCVRDASWHPYAPVIAATSWNGWGESLGTCTVHSWNDGLDDDEAEPKRGKRVGPKLQYDESFESGAVRTRSRFGRQALLRRVLSED